MVVDGFRSFHVLVTTPLGDTEDFSKPVSKTLLADRSFRSYESFNYFLLFSFQAEIDAFSF